MGELKFKTAPLQKALVDMDVLCPRRATIPTLRYARLKSHKGEVSLTATDLDCELHLPLPDVDAQCSGAWMIEPGLVATAIDGSTETALTPGEKGSLTVKAENLTLTRQLVIPAKDYPAMQTANWARVLPIPEAMLHKTLTKVRGSISTEETRYYLNGILVHASRTRDDKTLALVATDGHQLSLYETGLETGDFPSFILPDEAIKHLLRQITPKGERVITLRIAAPGAPGLVSPRVTFSCEDFTLNANCIDGTYPDFPRVIPSATPVDIDVRIGRTAITRLAKIAKAMGQNWHAPLQIDGGNGRMRLKSKDADGDAEVPIEGTGRAFGVNAYYLQRLARVHGDLRLTSSGPGNALRVQSDDPDFLGVLMPMRV